MWVGPIEALITVGGPMNQSSQEVIASVVALLVAVLFLLPPSGVRVQESGDGGMWAAHDDGVFEQDSPSKLSLSQYYAALVDYSDVLLVRNLNSATSMTLADYFRSERKITWSHVCNVTTSTTEVIDSTVFDALATQVKSCLNSQPPGTIINYLVTTKGVPLKTWRSPLETYASVDSELALVNGPYENRIGGNLWMVNPYFNDFVPFSKAAYNFYIVTRLTGYTVPEATGMIDNSTVAIGRRGRYVFDVDPGKDDGGGYQVGNDWMRVAATILAGRGFDVTLDQTSTFLTNYSDVAGYSSWGSNDGTWNTAVNSNSGFETDADANGVPDGWFFDDSAGNANISRNSTVVASGSWSIRIDRPITDSNVTSVFQNVSIIPERRYFLTGSVNYTNISGGRGIFLQLSAYDPIGNVLWMKNGSALSGTSGWRGLPQVIYEPIADAARLSIAAVFAEANGTAFLDNIRLVEIRPHNSWIPGSLAETAVSTGARSFAYGTSYGQSLVADLIRDGVTGVKGYVYEPYLDAVAHADILFDAYTRGYALGESFMMASEWSLSWQDTIIGDPKLAPYNLNYVPDLAVAESDITFSDSRPTPGEVIDFNVTLHNLGHFPATNVTLSFYLGNPESGGILLSNMTVTVLDGSTAATSITFDTTGLNGVYSLCAFADSPNEFFESDENNNIACNEIGVTSTYTLHLEPGHRFVSFPLVPSDSRIESVLSSMAGCFSYVRYYSGGDLANPWESYVPGRSYNTLLHLTNEMGFWIDVTSACDLVIVGVRPTSTTLMLHAGWNMIGFPSFQTSYTVADLKAALGAFSIDVEVQDISAAPYNLRRASDSYTISTGEGLWVRAAADSSWILSI